MEKIVVKKEEHIFDYDRLFLYCLDKAIIIEDYEEVGVIKVDKVFHFYTKVLNIINNLFTLIGKKKMKRFLGLPNL